MAASVSASTSAADQYLDPTLSLVFPLLSLPTNLSRVQSTVEQGSGWQRGGEQGLCIFALTLSVNEKKLKLNSSLFALELFALYNRAHWQVTKKKKKKKSNFYNKKKLTPAWPNDGNSQWNEHRDRRKPNSLRGGCVPLQRRRRRYIRPDCCCCCCCCCYNPLTGQLIL